MKDIQNGSHKPMSAKNPYKRTVKLPNWVMNLLKGGLIVVFLWQFYNHVPEGYWEEDKSTTEVIPIVTIEYSQLLGTTTPKTAHYLKWGDQTIHYLEPSEDFSAPFYELSINKISELVDTEWELLYKGQPLDIININAILLAEEGLPIFCEGKNRNCLLSNILQVPKPFELWLSIETVEAKRFFTKIRIGTPNIRNNPAIEEAKTFWEKLIKKEKFKDIDDLTVAKPVFKSNRYLFKWGDWERYVDRSLTEPRIKMDTATFKKLLSNHIPSLYKENEFIPFGFGVGFWDRKRWDRSCYFTRKEQVAPIIDTYPCLETLTKEATVGDHISIFIYQEEDFLEQITGSEFTNGIPPFILNGRSVRLYIAIELVADPITPYKQSLDLSTSQFPFQLHNGLAEGSKVKMDTTLTKNKVLLDHYKTSGSAEVVHIPDYKTVRRVINKEDSFIDPFKIDKTHVLVNKVYAVHTFPEFYDFDILPPTITSRGLSTVLDKTCYWLEDYINYRDPFSIQLGAEQVKLLQTTITIIPKEGEVVKYVTDNPDRYDINAALDNISPETSIYFDEILFERTNGERLAFPLAVGLHLK